MENLEAKERAIGKRYANIMQNVIRTQINAETTARTRELLATKVKSIMKAGVLDRITFVAPYYGFMLHFGFERISKNGKVLEQKPLNLFSNPRIKAVLNSLADELGEYKSLLVTAEIRF